MPKQLNSARCEQSRGGKNLYTSPRGSPRAGLPSQSLLQIKPHPDSDTKKENKEGGNFRPCDGATQAVSAALQSESARPMRAFSQNVLMG